MSVLYCTIPRFPAALARRDQPDLAGVPLVLVGPESRVLGLSAEAAACGLTVGMTAREAEIRCPEARLLAADPAPYRAESEHLLELLETVSPTVEPHGWGAAYVDLGALQGRAEALALLTEVGRSLRRELGAALQPALGWDSTKFTAQAAARRTRPGHLRAVDRARQRRFLRPLPVTLLPLPGDVLRRLGFLGLRTLGLYAALPPAAVSQQFGPAGLLAQRCARGEDDRPVVPRSQAPRLSAEIEFETPLVERALLAAALQRLVAPLLADLQAGLRACGQVRLTVRFDDGSLQERERTFLQPTADGARVSEALLQLLDRLTWPAAAVGLAVTLGLAEVILPVGEIAGKIQSWCCGAARSRS